MDLKDIGTAIVDGLPLGAYCRLVDLANAIRGRRHRIRPFRADGIHLASDGEAAIHICRRGRHMRYKRGVAAAVDGLARQYHLDAATIRPGGVFVDCGANVGELGFWARARGMTYLPFEPEPLEADCNDLNNFGGAAGTRRLALWKEDAELTFFSKPGSADSSLFDMGTSRPATKVAAVALDGLGLVARGAGTNVFKVEAEGAEPEVLEGARASLPLFDYVAIDCGYERGREQRHTFVETSRLLVDLGFRPVRAGFHHRVTILYENAGG